MRRYTLSEVENILISHCSYIANESVLLDENLLDFMDSLDGVELMMKLEEEFEITINDSDFDEISMKRKPTINKVIQKLKKYDVIDIKRERKEKIEKINESN